MSRCIGIVSAGAMGAALGRTWRDAGARVVTTLAGRSEATAVRAADAGLEILADLDAVVSCADVVVSIAPPDRALQVGADIAAAMGRIGRAPVLADLNAISPMSLDRVAAVAAPAGARILDGSISGGPPRPGGSTVLFLAGPDTALLADLHTDGLTARVVGSRIGAASAVKMCTASIYKGRMALLTQALLTARSNGVLDAVIEDLSGESSAQMDDAAFQLSLAASKAWRYSGEMREIAETQAAAGVRAELFDAMAIVWEMVSHSELGHAAPDRAAALDDVLDRMGRTSTPDGVSV